MNNFTKRKPFWTVFSLLLISVIVLFMLWILTDPNEDEDDAAKMVQNGSIVPKIDFIHHCNEEIFLLLNSYKKYYPNLTRLYSIGKSHNGNDLLVLEISDLPGVHEPGEPEIKLVGNIHGNEVVGRELLLHLIHYLLTNYYTNSTVKNLVDSTRIHIAPTINPDGYKRSHEGDCIGIVGRGNALDVDLNRNFPDQYETNQFNRVQQPETKSVMRWIRDYPFVLSAAFHGGALVVNYPFDNNKQLVNRESKSPDDDVFRYLSLQYSRSHPDMSKGYCYDMCDFDQEFFPDGITNGAKWYVISGGMQDWNYENSNCFEITIELGCQKYPSADKLPEYWSKNFNSIMGLIQSAHLGIHGFVKSEEGYALSDAIITVHGIDKNVTSYRNGDYWRLLVPNKQYTVTATKQGFRSQSHVVNLAHNQQLNFTLERLNKFAM